MRKVVILGAGFAGVSAYKTLARESGRGIDFSVTVISRDDYFLFTPLLHEVVAGHIDRSDLIVPAQDIFSAGDFIRAEILGVNFEKKSVDTSAGEISYDYLIIAQGSNTDFYGIQGAEENSLVLKNIRDALKIRDLIARRLSSALSRDIKEGEADFTVVGGGATGVELAAELAELFSRTIEKRFFKENGPFKVRILDGGSELLSRFPEFMRSEAEAALLRAGVSVQLNTRVLGMSSEGIRCLKAGEEFFIKSKNIIWVAGVRPVDIKTSPDIRKIGGRIAVNNFLMTDFPEVFAVGDGAVIEDDPQSSPYLAQAAEAQAVVAAKNVIAMINGRHLLRFAYQPKGKLISLGRFKAVGEVSGLRIRGFFGWWVWRTIYLVKMPSLKKKLVLVYRWTIDIFRRRDLQATG